MATYKWATPRKAQEYYLDAKNRTSAELWHAVHDGHIRVSIMDVEFANEQIRALLRLLHWNVPESEQVFELPIWMSVHIDDVERVLCGVTLPERRRGRPSGTSVQTSRDYSLAVDVSKLLGTAKANSVADAARHLISTGIVEGASFEAKMKKVQRAYAKFFRTD